MTPATAGWKRNAREDGKSATAGPLSAEELRRMDAYWRAANYLSVGQIYLMDNPLLKESLQGKCNHSEVSQNTVP
jgi:xylulose-5-phosphate/fructose-6-phosphate phosphoketolase